MSFIYLFIYLSRKKKERKKKDDGQGLEQMIINVIVQNASALVQQILQILPHP